MRAVELRKMDRFFKSLTDLQRYVVTTTAAAKEAGDCDCEITTAGIYSMRVGGKCVPTAEAPPPNYCRTLTHLAARIQLGELKLPAEHLSDPQLDTVIGKLAALVDRAPGLTERQFVIDLQTVLGASLANLAVQPTEENPNQ